LCIKLIYVFGLTKVEVFENFIENCIDKLYVV